MNTKSYSVNRITTLNGFIRSINPVLGGLGFQKMAKKHKNDETSDK
jgi:hypothetical protein